MSVHSNPNNDRAQTAKVAAVVSFYMAAALVMVFVNKAVLNSSPDLPLLFLLNQLLIAVALLHLSALFFPKVEIPRLDIVTAKKLFPVVSVNIIGLVFNTLCLRDVEASFFQIARGMQIPLTIAVSSFATRSAPTVRVIVAAGIVTAGFLLGISPAQISTLTLSSPNPEDLATHRAPGLISLIYGLLSALFIALHSVLIKSSLPHCNGSTIQLAYWTNLGSAALILPFVLLAGEPFRLLGLLSDPAWNGAVFAWGSAVTGVFGFLLCVAGLLSIKVTSPVTHMFSSAARSVIQTLLGVWIFGDLLNVNRATSIIVILLGTMFYTWAKHVEGQRAQSSANNNNKGGLPLPASSSSLNRSRSASSSTNSTLMNSDEEEEVDEGSYYYEDGKEKGDVYAMTAARKAHGHGHGHGHGSRGALGERERRARLAPVKEADEREAGNHNTNNTGRGEVLFDAEKAEADERV